MFTIIIFFLLLRPSPKIAMSQDGGSVWREQVSSENTKHRISTSSHTHCSAKMEMATCLLFLVGTALLLLPSLFATLNSMFVNAAYASDSPGVPQQQQQRPSSFHVERPLLPPFPNGPCDGTVITIPRKDLFPSQRLVSSSYENAILPPRDVKVWLPREYHTNDKRFPVLYCHDGQNGELELLVTDRWKDLFSTPHHCWHDFNILRLVFHCVNLKNPSDG